MSSIMHNVDQRTQLAGHNRMELLLFRLNGQQRFGINVFKVREVINTPKLIRMPKSHSIVRGIAHIRGKTISILDLSLATTGRPLRDTEHSSVIITEYNRLVQGFQVGSVDRIVNMNWKDVLPPPSGASGSSYLTAVAKVDGELVQIVDVEKVLDEVNRAGGAGHEKLESEVQAREDAGQWQVLVVDDSTVARNQIKRTLEKIGIEVALAKNGQEGLELLQSWAEAPEQPLKRLLMVVSDVEMPRMDGYTLTTAIRQDDRLRNLNVLLHTSLSGVFNNELVQRVGANDFLAKFHPTELAERVVKVLESRQAVPA
jgi:two-component system chemotaxis response regulator CheV